ncbi:hypothetical protein [Phaeovulum sp.]|uniref:hypothetical protein n=1 Tax=Phaeovulum sp. TaxID=2934796 RepID=UPI00272EFC0E|nr:hypothetical protein [Phaeovulum sp.]MDP1668259.1 hypothetical protein [Phaeovulum sp.]MDZ4118107.1 hypothetical protein [Phaeovulum sp.]
MTQKKSRRWLLSAITEAAKTDAAMPWQRGATRMATLAQRRKAAKPAAPSLRSIMRRA